MWFIKIKKKKTNSNNFIFNFKELFNCITTNFVSYCWRIVSNAKIQFNWTAESIFLESYIKHQELSNLYDFNKVNDEHFQIFFRTKDEIYAKLEKLRSNTIINKNNESIVYLTDFLLTKQIPLNNLKEWLNVANVFVDNELKVEKQKIIIVVVAVEIDLKIHWMTIYALYAKKLLVSWSKINHSNIKQ